MYNESTNTISTDRNVVPTTKKKRNKRRKFKKPKIGKYQSNVTDLK